MQRTGLEWVYRLLQEPQRLFRRYFSDLFVFGVVILSQWWQLRGLRSHAQRANRVVAQSTKNGVYQVVRFAERLDAATVREHAKLWPCLPASEAHVIFELSAVRFLDSTGVGLLVRLQKQLRANGRQLVLVAPTKSVLRALALMRLTEFFPLAADLTAARILIHDRLDEPSVVSTLNLAGPHEVVAWQGDIVAANEEQVWRMTTLLLDKSDADGLAAPPSGAGGQYQMNINLADVRFVDSTGVRLMLRVRKQARLRGIQLKFTAPQPAVLNVLRILRMDNYLLT